MPELSLSWFSVTFAGTIPKHVIALYFSFHVGRMVIIIFTVKTINHYHLSSFDELNLECRDNRMRTIWLITALFLKFFCLATATREGYIKTTFNALGLLNRTGNTDVNSINILRCIANYNVSGSNIVLIKGDGMLSIKHTGDKSEQAALREAFKECYLVLGFALKMSLVVDVINETKVSVIGPLSEVTSLAYVTSYKEVGRYTPTVPVDSFTAVGAKSTC